MSKAKSRERNIARNYFVELGKTCKEIAILIEVSENTLSKWRNEDMWDDLRAAKLSSTTIRTDNIRQIINSLADQRIALNNDLIAAEANSDTEKVSEIQRRIAAVDDGVSKWNKTLESLTKEGKIPLADHLTVMERLFNAMRKHNEKLYMQTIEFQEQYIHDLTANG